MTLSVSRHPSQLGEQRPILDDITIVIPTLGRPILQSSLQHIAAGSAWPAKIIVVDQGSSSEVAAMVAQFREQGIDVEHVPSTQRGRALGVNRGIERVTTRFVAVTDDDCFAEQDWIENMVTMLRANPDAIVTGRVDPEGDEEVVALKTSRTPVVYRRPLLKHDAVCGGNMGVALSTIERIGLFDEDPRLGCAEDCEWSYRALRSGVHVIYTPDVAVRHLGWRDSDQRDTQYGVYARSHGGFYGKYLRRGDWFIALRVLVHLGRATRRWLRGILSGDRELVFHGRAYVLGLIPGILAGWRKK